MLSAQVIGFVLILLGAVCGGSFGLPSKYAKQGTPWEVLWGPFFFFVTIFIPVAVAPLVVNDLAGVYVRAGGDAIFGTIAFGFLWGLGSMALGMSFAFIGLALAYALNYGAQIVFGSIVPMLLFDAEKVCALPGRVMAMILAGVAVCVAGVAVSGRAGILKQRSLKPAGPGPGAARQPRQGA